MLNLSKRQRSWSAAKTLVIAICLGSFAVAGCERKERVVDIEAPGVDVEVDRNVDTGEVEVDAVNN
jgi:hypothetical protein